MIPMIMTSDASLPSDVARKRCEQAKNHIFWRMISCFCPGLKQEMSCGIPAGNS